MVDSRSRSGSSPLLERLFAAFCRSQIDTKSGFSFLNLPLSLGRFRVSFSSWIAGSLSRIIFTRCRRSVLNR